MVTWGSSLYLLLVISKQKWLSKYGKIPEPLNMLSKVKWMLSVIEVAFENNVKVHTHLGG
jgi:hypothetical protein